MVKLAKGAKAQGKPKKAPPPMEVEESDEEMDESEEEVVPVKTPAKKANTPAKATPGKKAATPAKTAVTPGKKGATPAGAKNGKKAKKEESEDEEEFEDEESEEEKPVAKKPAAKKPVAKKEESEEEEEDEEDDEESEEEKPAAKKPVAKKTPAKKPSKEESEDEDEEEEPMEVATPVAKGKKAATPKKEESEEEEEEDDDDEEEDEDEEDDEDEEEAVEESGKRKKEMPKNKAAPEKKQRTEGSEAFTVFVANLNATKEFDELKDALREFFTKSRLPVQDVRIGASKKFGYVEFTSAEEVEKAIKLAGKKVLGCEIKIEKANTPAEKSKNLGQKKERDARTLFVKNLPYSTSVEDLQEVFENAKEVRLLTGKEGNSKGVAYVEFNTEADADQAIQDKQGTEIEGRSLFIDYTGEKSQNAGGRRSTGGSAGGDFKVLVINNLAYSATEEILQEVFEKATSIRIPQNNTGRPKGFAFVEFSSVEEAKEALDTLNNTEIEGRSIRIEISQGGGPQGGGRAAQSKTLFVKGLSEDTTEETLKDAFDGSVNARIVTDRDTGTSKGFGFVDFSSTEDAKAAMEAMEDGEIDGSKVTLDFAKPKGDGQRGGRGGFGGRGGGRGGFGGRGGGRGGFGGRGGGRGFGGRGGGRGGFGGRGGGGFRGKKTKFDE
ncbi:nucleolin isoform 3-T3 [Leptodactylus fuscus]|uniref:nucleolin isoform X3 n=1 Tax=Leptodactylus fuscus TaxID=238119 RepID=UPI003F4ED2CD